MVQVVFGGMPAWLLEAYLVELGGRSDGKGGAVAGDGWRATLASAGGGSGIAIGRVTVTVEGEHAQRVVEGLRRKAQRGGG
ncbi:MAG: DUF1952 domain-containing protein [Chloroflexota bacterium]|nr:DUF1952 domain-containing protein [Chloroflexota bacterium]